MSGASGVSEFRSGDLARLLLSTSSSTPIGMKQKHALGYADSFAAELAIESGAWLVTADPEFQKVGKALLVYPLSRHEK